jgi:hypothetical protein
LPALLYAGSMNQPVSIPLRPPTWVLSADTPLSPPRRAFVPLCIKNEDRIEGANLRTFSAPREWVARACISIGTQVTRSISSKMPLFPPKVLDSRISPHDPLADLRIFGPETGLFPFRKVVVPRRFLAQSEGTELMRTLCPPIQNLKSKIGNQKLAIGNRKLPHSSGFTFRERGRAAR